MVASAAPQASPSSATGTSLSLPVAALPGDVSISILASLRILCLLSHNMSLCRECGSPARATLIVDWSGRVRYMAAHRTDITRLDFVNMVNIINLVDITIIGTINIILQPIHSSCS